MSDWSVDKLLKAATIDYKGQHSRLSLNSKLSLAGGITLVTLAIIPGPQLLLSLPVAAYAGIKTYQTVADFFAPKPMVRTPQKSRPREQSLDYMVQGEMQKDATQGGITPTDNHDGNMDSWFNSMQEGKIMIGGR